MNTINNRSNVSFGMTFTPRTESIRFALSEKLADKAVTAVTAKAKLEVYLENQLLKKLDKLKGDSRSEDLLLDVFKGEKDEYHANVLFTKGTEIKKSVLVKKEGTTLAEALSSITIISLKDIRKTLNEYYNIAQENFVAAHNSSKFYNSVRVRTKFVDGSESLLPKLDSEYSLEDLKKLILESPMRFIFKVVGEQSPNNSSKSAGKVKLYVSTKKSEKFVEFPLSVSKEAGDIKVNPIEELLALEKTFNPVKELLKFEKKSLKPILQANREMKKLKKQTATRKKELYRVFSSPSRGLKFSDESKRLIMESDDLTPEQLKGLCEWAKYKSRKDLQFYIAESPEYGYDAVITSKNGQKICLNEHSDTLKKLVYKILSQDIEKM